MSIYNNKFKSTDIYGTFNVVDYAGILGIGAVPASFDISGNGVFRGIVDFSNNLPTSSQTPVNGNQLITKAFADATYVGTDITVLNNTWTGTNAFNTYLPTSTLTPSSGTDLTTKTYVDLKAPLASPALTGIPTAPTAAVATNTTQIATTAFVLANSGSGAASLTASNTFSNSNNYVNPATISLGGTVAIQPSTVAETVTAIATNTTGLH